ncbi:MAG: hypothetical protein PARBA_03379 [Parabacteroides sp.]
MELPNDPMMLFSFINMKLRDNYSSLDSLCDDMNVNKDTLISKLKEVGFEYNSEYNKFW